GGRWPRVRSRRRRGWYRWRASIGQARGGGNCRPLTLGEAVDGLFLQRLVDAGLRVEGKQIAQVRRWFRGERHHGRTIGRGGGNCKVRTTGCAGPGPERTPSAA